MIAVNGVIAVAESTNRIIAWFTIAWFFVLAAIVWFSYRFRMNGPRSREAGDLEGSDLFVGAPMRRDEWQRELEAEMDEFEREFWGEKS